MDKFLDKLSSYNILNNILPGVVFCNLLNMLLGVNVIKDGIIESLFMYYFIGMVISRVGSVIVEPICKKIKVVELVPYNEFLKASLEDEKVNILLESNNTYRTMLSMSLILLIIKIYSFLKSKFIIFTILANYKTSIIIISLVILFGFSYRKQTSYIKNRAECIIENINECKQKGD